MTRPDAVLAAFKAMPGAAAYTPSPQGGSSSAPGIGHISPLAMSLANERGYANTYGPFLPRTSATFTQGAFGPFSPILPVPVDEPAPGAEMPDARLWQYMVGWNLPVGTPGTEGIKLADFGTLKTLADLYSVARACIELRKNEIAGLDWDIVPTRDAAKAYNGKPAAMKDFGERRGQILRFLSKPDPDYFSFQTFISALLEEVFVFDALSILIRPKRGKGLHRGILGSDLDCLELISGATMRPLVGVHGETPRPPNPAYQQYLYGVPRSDYMTMITERDLEQAQMLGAEVNAWAADQFLYLPLVPRRWTPYGFPPIERALVPVMSGLQKQAYQLDFFKEGTIPAVYISPGDVNMTPNQIRELQDALNAFAGDPAWHHKVIVLPPGSRVDPQKPVDVADQFDDIVMTQVCQAFDVNPMEIGILPKVAASATPSQVKQFAQAGQTLHERLSTKPTLRFLADIFQGIIAQVLGQHDMRFTFEGMSEDIEEQALTSLLVQQVQNGFRSVDEAREQLEMQPWGLPMTSQPVYMSAAGPLPFTMPALPATEGQQQGGQQKPGGTQDSRNREVSRRAPSNGTAPLQQAGRAGGVAQPTPGHAAATGANAAMTGGLRRPGMVQPSARGSVASGVKAAEAELSSLTRHLNKGRQFNTWIPLHIPPAVMAMFAQDLENGKTPEQAADLAKTIMLGREDYAVRDDNIQQALIDYQGTLEKDRRTLEWEDLINLHGPKADAAFTAALAPIASLIDAWWSGGVVMTRQSLLDEVARILYVHLEPALSGLWADAWRMNDVTAGGYFDAWEASHGRDILEKIVRSRLAQVDDAITAAVQAGTGPDDVIRNLDTLLDVENRVRAITVTETGRAATAASVAAFRAEGYSYKMWITRRDGLVCDRCRAAEAEGPLPLDTLFEIGLDGPPAHPNCRCDLLPFAYPQPATASKHDETPTLSKEQVNYRPAEDATETCGDCVMWRATAGRKGDCTLVIGEIKADDTCDRWFRVETDPVYKDDSEQLHGEEGTARCERGHTHHGEYGGAGVLVRHKGDDGKTRYLLQKRSPGEDDPGTWALPGGALLEGETALQGAFREAQEEMGPFPRGVEVSHHVVDDHGGWAWTTLVCDTPEMFHPNVGEGDTPDETGGYGWFTQDEIKDLPLHPAFSESWDAVRNARDSKIIKCSVRRVDLDGQVIWEHPEPCPCTDPPASGGGGPEFMSHDAQGIQDGRAGGSRGGGTAGMYDDPGLLSRPHGAPPPSETAGPSIGYVRDVPPAKAPIPQGYQGGHWPEGGHGTGQPPSSPIGGENSVSPQIKPPKNPKRKNKGVLDRVLQSVLPQVMAQMEENFPPQALEWVPQGKWSGPSIVSLDLVDFHDMKTWSAFHETDRVKHFERLIEEGEYFNPVILIKVPGHDKYRVVDGHHRALAYRNLGRPIGRAWIGVIPFGLVHVAEETHSSQLHQGSSAQNA